MTFLSLCIVLNLAVAVYCVPVSQITAQDESYAESCLKKLFNLTEESSPSARWRISPMTKKLGEMQRFFGLQITGILDAETLEMMKSRCAVTDGKITRFSTFGNAPKCAKNTLYIYIYLLSACLYL
ncbi:hypothetical protein PAMP_007481 [Pampus punctatissimus]